MDHKRELDHARQAVERAAYSTGIILVLLSISACVGSKDWLSGTYEVRLAESRQVATIELGIDVPRIHVRKSLQGWSIRQGPDTEVLEPVEDKLYEALLPGYSPEDGFQCASEVHIILCHVKPMTALKDIDGPIIAHTGYFIMRLHYGLIELERVPSHGR